MNHEKTYNGSCFCGAVQLTVSGQPEGMGYCHCESCRRWSAGPVNAFTLWKPEAVRITQGAENIGTYTRTWIYPSQRDGWAMVSTGKFGSWFLLLIISYTLVALIKKPHELGARQMSPHGPSL